MGALRHAELLDSFRRIATSVASGEGVELVDLSLRGSSNHRSLRVDIDRAGPEGVNVDDCKRVSHALGEALDESDLIEARYVLEVSSPGIDRPIETDDDYRRNVGRRVAITVAAERPESSEGPGGGEQRQFRGELLSMNDGLILIRTDDGSETKIPRAGVTKACQDVAF